jgi:hypothetical protein
VLGRSGLVALALVGPPSASAGPADEEGFFLLLDAGFATPQNTDEVVALVVDSSAGPGEVQDHEAILTDWDSDPAGRLEFGYRWPRGGRVSIAYWSFDHDEALSGDGPPGATMFFGIGPAIFFQGASYGTLGEPGHFDIVADVEASSLEFRAGKRYEMGDALVIEGSAGLRFASFQETMSGFYDSRDSSDPLFGDERYGAFKSNEGDMAGLQLAARASYAIREEISVNAGLAFSALQGDVTSRSNLLPVGAVNSGTLPASFFSLKDDRSGTILDLDINVVWHPADDRYRVWVGWEHSSWNGIAADLAREQTAPPAG